MGVAIYIVLDKQIDGLNSLIDGKMLAQTEEDLTEAATRLAVRPLTEFISMNPEDAKAFFESEGMDGAETPDEQWFGADEGLTTVRALLGKLDRLPAVRTAEHDLRGLERVLLAAKEGNVRWHLAVDF